MNWSEHNTVFRQSSLLAGCFLVAAACGCTRYEPTVTLKKVAAEKEEGTAAAPESAEKTAASWGNLAGTVTLDGTAPSLPLLVSKGDSGVKDSAVCSVASIPDESLVVNPQNNGIANVVIFLAKPKTVKPDLAAVPTSPVIFDQQGCRFMPHLLLCRVNQPILIKSDDAVAHNTHTFPTRNTGFNSAIGVKDRAGVPLKYSKGEANPVEVKCDLHPWMRAYHFPVEHPYAALTDGDGKFRIAGLPAGKHQFKVWQEKAGFLEQKLEVTIEAEKDAALDLKVPSAKFK